MKAIGIIFGSLLLLMLLLLMLVVALGEAMLHSVKPGTPISWMNDPLPVGNQQSDIVQAALLLESKLSGPRLTLYDPADPVMQRVRAYWQTYCTDQNGNLCSLAQPGTLQCVEFVSAVYWLAGDALPSIQNARDFWLAYASQPGWQRISATSAAAPGDLIVWSGGAFGHIAVVVNYQAPTATQAGMIAVAQANAGSNTPEKLYQMTIMPGGQITTWAGYSILGFLRHTAGQSSTGSPSNYRQYARQAALLAGIAPDVFIRQIQQESGFDPTAISPAGAVGIAQFLPSTAAGIPNPLGSGMLNPWDPYQALTAAAHLMAQELSLYEGDQGKALAAYNAGDQAVQDAIMEATRAGHASSWLSYLPLETQHYVQTILRT